MDIVIAGGGLVGLTTAVLLDRAGHDVTVLEQAPEIRAAGAGIGLWENALRQFDRAGIGPAVRGLGHTVENRFFDRNGRQARATDGSFLLVPRPALNTLLADALGREKIQLTVRATGYTEKDGRITVAGHEADLLIGADGVYSTIRSRLLPGSDAQPHGDHYAWRAVVPSGDERPGGSVLTVGDDGTRGGFTRVADGRTMWMVNQFHAGPLTGGKRDRALARARHLAGNGWNDDLRAMIERTPEDAILENRITLVPPLPRYTGGHVALIGDAAHGLSPHLSAGGTLGIEDAGVLLDELAGASDLRTALIRYETARMARFARVREFSANLERARTATEFADAYATFNHWMLGHVMPIGEKLGG